MDYIENRSDPKEGVGMSKIDAETIKKTMVRSPLKNCDGYDKAVSEACTWAAKEGITDVKAIINWVIVALEGEKVPVLAEPTSRYFSRLLGTKISKFNGGYTYHILIR